MQNKVAEDDSHLYIQLCFPQSSITGWSFVEEDARNPKAASPPKDTTVRRSPFRLTNPPVRAPAKLPLLPALLQQHYISSVHNIYKYS